MLEFAPMDAAPLWGKTLPCIMKFTPSKVDSALESGTPKRDDR
jgi:hypothetical protein